ncbi:MAG: CRISPR system precrRNA processing endoribonuclease RAMP protein Cas6 [Bacteroidetes bacterium]|jgi:CRISPR-associated endoribonuclease Cas6|nr:CRISPR system precrRNA processing endoribonuclease RAMP protein Cas6 [Bacteroidota bacterium]MBT6686024.1 CRISPR system precrRNA processing endoribonuclease RAMP protein Cas6 [Bacteroidota bacterium]MBT7144533.1 CRISPR system precrRNA processing endoribonuclease RAMP protein Cas6 [Bacteroidota bacterium]MBT7492704.1 CRISPR system precrRNA processing endoribonuclease RAMP protein Cas6 [Bacteroidota bacterium]
MNNKIELSHLKSFELYHLKFLCEAKGILAMPAFWGATFHGLFGRALHKQHCSQKTEECFNCFEKENCTYIKVFAPVPQADYANKTKFIDMPRPVIFRKAMSEKAVIFPQETFSFEIIIVGEAILYLNQIVDAFFIAAEMGIGRRRAKFQINECMYKTEASGNFEALYVGKVPKAMSLDNFNLPNSKNINLNFVTPLHLKDKNDYSVNPPAKLILSRIYERVCLLNHFYCGGELPENTDFQKMEIPITHNLYNFKFGRYNHKLNTWQKLIGRIGTISLKTEDKNIGNHLLFGQFVGVGKMASMGCGMYRMSFE